MLNLPRDPPRPARDQQTALGHDSSGLTGWGTSPHSGWSSPHNAFPLSPTGPLVRGPLRPLGRVQMACQAHPWVTSHRGGTQDCGAGPREGGGPMPAPWPHPERGLGRGDRKSSACHRPPGSLRFLLSGPGARSWPGKGAMLVGDPRGTGREANLE